MVYWGTKQIVDNLPLSAVSSLWYVVWLCYMSAFTRTLLLVVTKYLCRAYLKITVFSSYPDSLPYKWSFFVNELSLVRNLTRMTDRSVTRDLMCVSNVVMSSLSNRTSLLNNAGRARCLCLRAGWWVRLLPRLVVDGSRTVAIDAASTQRNAERWRLQLRDHRAGDNVQGAAVLLRHDESKK